MNVRNVFETATKRLVAGTALAAAMVLAPSAWAQQWQVRNCVTDQQVADAGQVFFGSAEVLRDGQSTGMKVRWSTDVNGREAYEYIVGPKCNGVTRTMTDVKLVDPSDTGLRPDLALQGSPLYTRLSSGHRNGLQTMFQARVVSGFDQNNIITLLTGKEFKNGLMVLVDLDEQWVRNTEYYQPKIDAAGQNADPLLKLRALTKPNNSVASLTAGAPLASQP